MWESEEPHRKCKSIMPGTKAWFGRTYIRNVKHRSEEAEAREGGQASEGAPRGSKDGLHGVIVAQAGRHVTASSAALFEA